MEITGAKKEHEFFSAFAKLPSIKVQKFTFPSAKYVPTTLPAEWDIYFHFYPSIKREMYPGVVLICLYCFTRSKSLHIFKDTINTSPLVQC